VRFGRLCIVLYCSFGVPRKWYPEDRSRKFARLIATGYGLDVSEEEAREMLEAATARATSSGRGEA